MGGYSDTYVVTDGGEWKVRVKYPGSKCNGSSVTGGASVVVSLPPKEGGTGGTGIFPPYLRKLWLSVQAGSTHPIGDLNKNAEANIYAMADLSFPLSNNFNLQLLYGIAKMTNSSTISGINPKWTHLSMNMQAILPSVYDMKRYIRAGIGNYRDKNNSSTVGANIGLGGITKIKNQLILSPGLDLHLPGFSKKDNKSFFITAHIGFLFS